MADFEMKIEGMAELKQRLDTLAKKDAARILNKALLAGAEVFQTEEEERAPERPELPSTTALPPGALRRDVEVRKIPGKLIYTIGPGKFTKRAAHLVEFGHRLVRGGRNRIRKFGKNEIQVGTGKVVGMVPPHPYVRPSFEGAQQAAQDAIIQSMVDDFARMDYRSSLTKGQ